MHEQYFHKCLQNMLLHKCRPTTDTELWITIITVITII